MVNQSLVLAAGVWTLASDNVDYLIQNRRSAPINVKAMATETPPTDNNGAFELVSGDLIGSTLLTGYIYCRCDTDTTIVLAK